MDDVFAHDILCGACGRNGSDSDQILRCQLCPAVFHYPCAGYYDIHDGPDPGQPWLCFRCAANAPGGLKGNWVVPKDRARLKKGQKLLIAAQQDNDVAYDLFYHGTVIECQSSSVKVLWDDFMQDASNPEIVDTGSYRIWHGTLDEDLWEDKGDHAYAPISRSLCPDTFAEIAEANGVPDPTAGLHVPLLQQRNLQRPANSGGLVQEASTSGGGYQAAADQWLQAVRRYGHRIGDVSLQEMPDMLDMRRNMQCHPYVFWLIVQGWGGARAVQQRKLWARVATVLHAPQTMTNRSSKMAQLWKVHHFEVLVGKDAAAAGIVQPRAEKDGSAMLNHDIVTLWPACVIGGTDQPPRKRGRPRKNSLPDSLPRKQPRRRSARGSCPAELERDESMELSGWQSWSAEETSEGQPCTPRDAGPVSQAAPQLRKLGLPHLPPKVPPGSNLRPGAIAASYTKGIRHGEYMIRLDALCIHTSLVPCQSARQLARDAKARAQKKVHFVITEQNYLGGWWDAKLDAVKQGSLLEGGMRFKVLEHYEGDPDNPNPSTWVPLVYYGPQAYPYQTPQVMIRPARPWSERSKTELKVGQQVEGLDDAADEDTVRWRGLVQEIDTEQHEVKLQLMINPYGSADASADPETGASNFLVLPESHMRPVNEDDLEDMCREPDIEPDANEVVGIASTDDIELKVLPPSTLCFGPAHRRITVQAFATHSAFEEQENAPSRASAVALQFAGAVVLSIEEVYRHPRQAVSTLGNLEQPSTCSHTSSEGGVQRAPHNQKVPGGVRNGTAAPEHGQPAAQQDSQPRDNVYDGSPVNMSCAYHLMSVDTGACHVPTRLH